MEQRNYPGLSFYDQLAGPATWSCVSGTPEAPLAPNTWIWGPGLQLVIDASLDDLNRFIESGWRYVADADDTDQQAILLPLWGQLGHTRQVHILGGNNQQLWASAADLEHAERVPVVLAFTAPDQLTRFARPVSAAAQVLRIVEVLPPPAFGTVAMVAAESDAGPGWQCYTIDQLSENAQTWQRELADRLRALAGGDLGWVPVTSDFEVVASGNYQRMKRRLESEILSRRDATQREHLHKAIELLDEAHTRYQAIRAARHRLSREQWLTAWKEIHKMAQGLAAEYLEAHRAATAVRARHLPAIPRIFDSSAQVRVPSELPVYTITKAQAQGKTGTGWHLVGDYPTFQQRTERHNTAVQVRPESSDIVPDDGVIASLWAKVHEMSDLDADVFLAMLAQAKATTPDEDGCVWITGDCILDYRGVQPKMNREDGLEPRRAGHRQEDLIEIARCVGRQSAQWVIIRSQIEEASGKRGRRVYTHESRLIEVAEVIRQHELLPPENRASTSSHSVAWRYRIGTWLKPFIEGPNRHIAWLCQQTLSYDPYHEQWEKRLARYLMFHLRINASGGGSIPRGVGMLIRELSLPIDERNPQRTRDRFERAMNRLQADGQIESWQYTDDSPLPARGWLETWLGRSVRITAAPLIQERYASIAERARAHRGRAEMLRALRAAQGDGKGGKSSDA